MKYFKYDVVLVPPIHQVSDAQEFNDFLDRAGMEGWEAVTGFADILILKKEFGEDET